MAASGFTPISLYFSATGAAVPVAGNLVAGELALNTNDGKLYYKNSSGVVTLLAGATAGPAGGSTTQVQYNNAGVLAGITGATTNGTALTLVAPVLGTPASGIVTNLTGTASININGTVGATTANTGAFTTISASGTATMATINASGAFTSSFDGGGNPWLSRTGATTQAQYIQIANTGGAVLAGIESSVGGVIITGSSAYDLSIRGPSGIAFSANNGAAVQMRLASTGLSVTGTFSASGTSTMAAINASGQLTAVTSQFTSGADSINNGGFSSSANWVLGANWSIGAGVATAATASSFIYQSNTGNAAKVYALTYTVTSYTSGTIQPWENARGGFGPTVAAAGTYTALVTGAAWSNLGFSAGAFVGSIDNVSLKEVSVYANGSAYIAEALSVGGTLDVAGNIAVTSNATVYSGSTSYLQQYSGHTLLNQPSGSSGYLTENNNPIVTWTSAGASVTGTLGVTGTSTMAAINASGKLAVTAAVPQAQWKGTDATTSYQEYYYNTSTLAGYIGNGSGLLSGAANSDFIVRSENSLKIAAGGNTLSATFTSTGVTIPGTLGVTGASTLTGIVGIGGAASNGSGYSALAQIVAGPNAALSLKKTDATAQEWVFDVVSGGALRLRDVTAATAPLSIAASTGAVTIPGTLGVTGTSTLTGFTSNGSGFLNATVADFGFRTAGVDRWIFEKAGTESGSNAGGDLTLYRYADNGSFLGTAMNFVRSSGAVTVTSGLLGVGVTPSAWSGGSFSAIQSTANFGTSAPNNYFMSNLYYGAGAYRYVGTDLAAMCIASAGRFDWYTAPSGTAGNTAVTSNVMTLNNAGSLILTPVATGGTANLDLYNIVGNEADHYYTVMRLANGTAIGSIRQVSTTSAVVYNTTSDYRVKDLFGSFTTAREMLSALTVLDGQFKGSEHRIPLMVAHEVQAVTPWAVTGEKDAVDDEGLPVYQQMAIGAQEALLIAGWQDHEARLAALQAEFQSYKSSHP